MFQIVRRRLAKLGSFNVPRREKPRRLVLSQLFRRSDPLAMPHAGDWEDACNLHELARRGVSNPGVIERYGV